jgi:hypothetical protein
MKVNHYSLIIAASCVGLLVACGISSAGARRQASTVGKVTEYLSKKSGVRVLASSSAQEETARMPAENEKVTAETVEGFIQFLVKNMPDGALYAKLYLPDPPKGKDWSADEVIAFAIAQSKLYGTVGTPRDDGKVEILSQLLAPDKAKEVISTLGLKPVYIVTMGRGNFTGVWNATFGQLTLRQSGGRVTGSYTTNQGEITGTVNGDVVRFR